MPRIAVAIPTYRGAALIGHTLRSLIAQTYTDWSCVVVNDGEEDGTAAVVAGLGDARIRYVCDGRRRGQLRNFNRAILEALKSDPDFVRLFSADDVLYPYNFADVVALFDRDATVGLVASHFDGIDGAGRVVLRADLDGWDDIVMSGREYLRTGVAVGNTIGGPSSVALRREAIETAGLFDTRLDFAGDQDLWYRVASSWSIAWVGRRAGYQYRYHDASVTGRDKFSMGKFVDKIQSVRRVASAEALLGPRWWLHQYTIGFLHSVNVVTMLAMARRGRWDGVRAGLAASMREGLVWYSPLWLPRILLYLTRGALGLSPAERVFWRRAHASLQPRLVPVVEAQPGESLPTPEVAPRAASVAAPVERSS